MVFKKKRKASAVEPATAASPPAKRGRPPKAENEQTAAASPPASAPNKRGRPRNSDRTGQSDVDQEQVNTALPKRGRPRNVETTALTSSGQQQGNATPSKKVKPNTSATRSSKRISDGVANAIAAEFGPRERRQTTKEGTNGAVKGRASSSVVAVKKAKTKGKGKGKASTKQPAEPEAEEEEIPISSVSKAKKANKGANGKKTAALRSNDDAQTDLQTSSVSVNISSPQDESSEDEKADDEDEDDGHNYWLMKAEPNSRMEKGKEVKFSIDDLRAAAEPEGWDGVRNATARNNMRMMLKGDLAFFYHSNCKTPGIAGVMEIVQEHSLDESALDPNHPYYDAKSTAENPKWCKVGVDFRQKFPELVKLKELQKYAKDGGILQNMQTLRQSRLSVSKVTKKEWNFIMGLVEDEEVDPTAPAPEARMIVGQKITNGGAGQSSGAAEHLAAARAVGIRDSTFTPVSGPMATGRADTGFLAPPHFDREDSYYSEDGITE